MYSYYQESEALYTYLSEHDLSPSTLYNNNIYKDSFIVCLNLYKKIFSRNKEILQIFDDFIRCFNIPSGIPNCYELENAAFQDFVPKAVHYADTINEKEDDVYAEIAEHFSNVEYNELDKTLKTEDFKYLALREMTRNSEGFIESLLEYFRYVCRGYLVIYMYRQGLLSQEKILEIISLDGFKDPAFCHPPIMLDISESLAQKSALFTAAANIARLYHEQIFEGIADMADGNVDVLLWKNEGGSLSPKYISIKTAEAIERLKENDGLALWPILYLLATEKSGVDLNASPASLTETMFGPKFTSEDKTAFLEQARLNGDTDEFFNEIKEWIFYGFPIYVQKKSENNSWFCIAGAYRDSSGEKRIRLYSPAFEDLDDVSCEELVLTAQKLEINRSEELKEIPAMRLTEFDIITDDDIESYNASLISKEMLTSYVKCIFDMYAVLLSSYTLMSDESVEFKRLLILMNDSMGYISRSANCPDDIIEKQLKPLSILANDYSATLEGSLPIRIRQRKKICNIINLLCDAFYSSGEMHSNPFSYYRHSFTKAFAERLLQKNEFDTDEVMVEFEVDTLFDDSAYLKLLNRTNFVYLIDPQPKMLDEMIAKYEAM